MKLESHTTSPASSTYGSLPLAPSGGIANSLRYGRWAIRSCTSVMVTKGPGAGRPQAGAQPYKVMGAVVMARLRGSCGESGDVLLTALCQQDERRGMTPARRTRGAHALGNASSSGLIRSSGSGNTMVEALPLLDMSASVCR